MSASSGVKSPCVGLDKDALDPDRNLTGPDCQSNSRSDDHRAQLDTPIYHEDALTFSYETTETE
ncbi:hypothetical protein OUZ56_011627 [Daphnia magna]|uniref:Uncharacterized protein n=1 Tax=Daphnia magna TaxID=35525 RepID=A0ABQ9Z0S2_9CRUS|nr:hypothetical protein OUZ56_011627 [Daphnia magna]